MKHLQVNKEIFKSGKQSIVRIMNEDSMCLARAIVVARVHAQRPYGDSEDFPAWKKRWERIKRRDILSPQQRDQAVNLMEFSDCPLDRPCGPREWDKLQDALLPQFRLKVYEFKKGTPRLELLPLYKGKGDGICLNVSLDQGHYYPRSPGLSVLLRSLRRGI